MSTSPPTPRSDLAAQAQDSFAEAFEGAAPKGLWFAPGRVNLMGEHTDYNDGFAFPAALPLGSMLAVAPRSDSLVRGVSALTGERAELDLDTLAPGQAPGWLGYLAGVGWAARRSGLTAGGLDLAVATDLPMGAGLSSSASLSCAAAVAWRDLHGWDVDGDQLADLARRAENEIVGAPTGVMDQLASIHGRADHALLLDTRARDDGSIDLQLVPLELDRFGLRLMVIDSHTPHMLTDGLYGQRRADCERAAQLLGVAALRDVPIQDLESTLAKLPDRIRRRARHIVTDSDRAQRSAQLLLAGHDPRELGPLMNASHASMREDFEITVPTVDSIQAAAVDAGAYGARMTGGGFGGCVIALVQTEALETVLDAVRSAATAAGHPMPTAFAAVAGQGARAW